MAAQDAMLIQVIVVLDSLLSALKFVEITSLLCLNNVIKETQ